MLLSFLYHYSQFDSLQKRHLRFKNLAFITNHKLLLPVFEKSTSLVPHAGYHATPIPFISYSDFAADIYSESYQIFAFGTRLITNAIKELMFKNVQVLSSNFWTF